MSIVTAFQTWFSGISYNFGLVLWTLAGIFCMNIMQGLMHAAEYGFMSMIFRNILKIYFRT
jgi:hypothetical protein